MTDPHRGSLRRKLLSVMLLTTLAAVVVALGAMIAYDLRAYHQGGVNDLNAQADLLGRTTGPALAFDDAQVASENLGSLRLQPRMQAAGVYGPGGELFASYLAEGEQAALPSRPAADGVRIAGRTLEAFKPILVQGERMGTVYLRADYELYDRLLNYGGIALIVAAIAMLFAFGVSLWLQRIVTGPVLAIGTIARDVVQRRDYSRRAHKLSNDEVGELVDAFNDMLSEIERRTVALEASNTETLREVRERRAAQQEVMRLNAGLEQRVQERTLQLEASNRELAAASVNAETANRAKSEFLSSMSHELRTPLNAIIGFGQLLRMPHANPSSEQSKVFVDHIVNAGRHLLTLINEVLNLAQIEAGKLNVSLQPLPLADVLAECRTMVEAMATPRGIAVRFPAHADLAVVADETRLKQVLLNLLSNAVKYNRPNGSVELHCTTVSGDRVRLTVRDTGSGLRPDQVDTLFQPFNRLGQEAGTEEGTGIGLVVTKRLIELMRGSIGVSSTPGVGSEFWVELPRVVAAARAADPAQTELTVDGDGALPRRRATVLCVEDNQASLELVRHVLSLRPELELISATDGRRGVELAMQRRPQLILMDNNMPELTGRQAQAILRQNPDTAHIPVIALSADAMPKTVAEVMAAGYYGYVTKPIDVSELLAAIDRGLEFSRSHRES